MEQLSLIDQHSLLRSRVIDFGNDYIEYEHVMLHETDELCSKIAINDFMSIICFNKNKWRDIPSFIAEYNFVNNLEEDDKTNKHIDCLMLHKIHDISKTDLKDLFEILIKCNIHTLWIGDCSFSDDDANKNVYPAIINNDGFTMNNVIIYSKFKSLKYDNFEIFFNMLQQIDTYQLDCAECDFNFTELCALTDFIYNSYNIEKLNISGVYKVNQYRYDEICECIYKLCETICLTETISTLDLSKCDFKVLMSDVFDALRYNESITTLKLFDCSVYTPTDNFDKYDYNTIDDQLEYIYIIDDSLSSYELLYSTCIHCLLRNNRTILNLEIGSLDKDYCFHFKNSLERNNTIISLTVNTSNVSIVDDIITAMKKNRSVFSLQLNLDIDNHLFDYLNGNVDTSDLYITYNNKDGKLLTLHSLVEMLDCNSSLINVNLYNLMKVFDDYDSSNDDYDDYDSRNDDYDSRKDGYDSDSYPSYSGDTSPFASPFSSDDEYSDDDFVDEDVDDDNSSSRRSG